jgi:hypothetical protein
VISQIKPLISKIRRVILQIKLFDIKNQAGDPCRSNCLISKIARVILQINQLDIEGGTGDLAGRTVDTKGGSGWHAPQAGREVAVRPVSG